jgi:hypothetical protein
MYDDPYFGEPVLTTKNNLKDGRSMKRTKRVHPVNTKFALEEVARMKAEAERRGLAMNAMIVLALEQFYAAVPGER